MWKRGAQEEPGGSVEQERNVCVDPKVYFAGWSRELLHDMPGNELIHS